MVRKPSVSKGEIYSNVEVETVPFNVRNVSLFELHSESSGQTRLFLSPADRALNISRYSGNAQSNSANNRKRWIARHHRQLESAGPSSFQVTSVLHPAIIPPHEQHDRGEAIIRQSEEACNQPETRHSQKETSIMPPDTGKSTSKPILDSLQANGTPLFHICPPQAPSELLAARTRKESLNPAGSGDNEDRGLSMNSCRRAELQRTSVSELMT